MVLVILTHSKSLAFVTTKMVAFSNSNRTIVFKDAIEMHTNVGSKPGLKGSNIYGGINY